ncbi:chloride channel protein [Isoptericola sp. b441]|uniref:Chloride channel protein n=1 Tax=Actinotalea lenta TaxID=3064654 RepID=A0ABT9D4X9_9CELL|nr:chloride channel protein [Isoptericola sp. b441]MDO8105772.1 chloride channel protein [Isoptericola sp. b441]
MTAIGRRMRAEVVTAVLALAVGVVAGLGAVAFRALISLVHNLFFGGRLSLTYDALVHTDPSRWGVGVILVPVVGALAVVVLVKRFAPEAKGHGVPEVIDAIHFKGGRIRPRVAGVKALASSISIGSGGSVGREGPIIQIGATFGSILAQWLKLPEWQRLTLIAAGGGGGIAATFNTPIGGVIFAAEILIVEISARTLIPVLIATGTASVIAGLFFGDQPSFVIPALTIDPPAVSPMSLVGYSLLAILLGLVGWLYTRSIYWAEDLFDRLPVNDYLRHVIGMLVVGVTIYLLMARTGHYWIEGVGYATIQEILQGTLTAAGFMVLLAGLKLLSTSLTLGSGASGGVFSPALFIGATLGAAFATVVDAVAPGMHLNPVNAAVVGMACMVGASTGAAVTAVVMTFEMTRDFQVLIPLIVAVSLAYLVRRSLMSDTIYTLKLSRRGQQLPAALQSSLYLTRRAVDFVHAPFVVKPADATLSDLPLTWGRRNSHIVLAGPDGGVAGVVTAHRIGEARRSQRSPATPLLDLAGTKPTFAPADAQIVDLIGVLRGSGVHLTVLTEDGARAPARAVKGVLTHEDVVEATNMAQTLRRTPVARTDIAGPDD